MTSLTDRISVALRGQKLSPQDTMLLAVEALESELRAEALAAEDLAIRCTVSMWKTPSDGFGFDGHPLQLGDDGLWTVAASGSRNPAGAGRRYATVADYLRTWWQPYDAARRVVEHVTGRRVNTTVDAIFGRAS